MSDDYTKISFKNRADEIAALKSYDICTWMGRHQKFLIVTVQNENGEKINKKFEFKTVNEYSWFIHQLRRLENGSS